MLQPFEFNMATAYSNPSAKVFLDHMTSTMDKQTSSSELENEISVLSQSVAQLEAEILQAQGRCAHQ